MLGLVDAGRQAPPANLRHSATCVMVVAVELPPIDHVPVHCATHRSLSQPTILGGMSQGSQKGPGKASAGISVAMGRMQPRSPRTDPIQVHRPVVTSFRRWFALMLEHLRPIQLGAGPFEARSASDSLIVGKRSVASEGPVDLIDIVSRHSAACIHGSAMDWHWTNSGGSRQAPTADSAKRR